MKKLLFLTIFIAYLVQCSLAQENMTTDVVFRFSADKSLLFSTKSSNSYNLLKLSQIINSNRKAIMEGELIIYMNAYFGASKKEKERLKRANIMNENLQNEIIERDKLEKENFILNDHAYYFDNIDENIVLISIKKPMAEYSNNSYHQMLEAEEIETSSQSTANKFQSIYRYSQLLTNLFNPTKASVAFNVGIPFYWGDMVSMASDKTYIGYSFGVQGNYNIIPLIGIGLSIDYSRGKAGARKYANEYYLERDGMTYYSPQPNALPYADLYSKISTINIGISCDINVLEPFFPQGKIKGFSAILSPTFYGQIFRANIYRKNNDTKYSDGSTKPKGLSFGLGGSLSLRYNVWENIDIQLKNSLIWITNNKFDAIVNPYDKSKQNAMWVPQIGVIWNIK